MILSNFKIKQLMEKHFNDRAGWIKGNNLPNTTKLQTVQTSVFLFQNTFIHLSPLLST